MYFSSTIFRHLYAGAPTRECPRARGKQYNIIVGTAKRMKTAPRTEHFGTDHRAAERINRVSRLFQEKEPRWREGQLVDQPIQHVHARGCRATRTGCGEEMC
jgi:transposase